MPTLAVPRCLVCLFACLFLALPNHLKAHAPPVKAPVPARALLPPQLTYNQNGRRCRVSMRVAEHCVELGEQDVEHYMKFGERNMESWRLEVKIENLGKESLVVYNPFFHPAAVDRMFLSCGTASLNVYDRTGQLRGDRLAWTGGSAVMGVARRWMSIPPGESYTGSYAFRMNNPKLSKDSWRDGPFYLQAVFIERFLSDDPFDRFVPPIHGNYSTREEIHDAFDSDSSRRFSHEDAVKWLAKTSGGTCLRSNVVKIQFADREDVEPVP